MMRRCPTCGREQPAELHWCDCGEFLAWDPPTPGADAGTEPTNGEAKTAVMPHARVRGHAHAPAIELNVPGADLMGEAPLLRVAAGGTVELFAAVRNQSTIVERYVVTVVGLPREWWTVEPATADLMPFDAGTGYDAELTVRIHPPRSPEAEARLWPFEVVATASSGTGLSDRAKGAVEIEPYTDMTAVARPTVAVAKRAARMAADVRNRGNGDIAVVVFGVSPEDTAVVEPWPDLVAIGPGASGTVPFDVRARKRHWIGRPIDHRLELEVRPQGEHLVPAPFTATFRQRAWIAWWVPLLVLLLALLILLVLLLLPSSATVPDVRGARSAFEAQKYLEDEGLTLDPGVRAAGRRAGVRPGTVVDQSPSPGEEVDEGKAVTVLVAAGRRTVPVPDLKGMSAPEADSKLQEAGLTLGAASPELEGDTVVVEQVPAAGERRKAGTPVAIVLGPEPKEGGKPKPPKEEPAAVPEAVEPGATATAAVAALEKAGLTPVVRERIDPAKDGEVLSVTPAEGAPKDGKVVLVVSTGFPRLAYDNGVNAVTTGGADGAGKIIAGTATTAGPAAVASDAAWSPDGRFVAFSRGRRVLVARPGKKEVRLKVGSRVQPLHPAFAPGLRQQVLAFVDRGAATNGDKVCWSVILDAKGAARTTCRKFDDWQIDALTWHPGGKILLLSAKKLGSDFGLIQLNSKRESSPRAVDWTGKAELVTPIGSGKGTRAAAYSEDGEQLAVVTNHKSREFRVGVTEADNVALDDLPVLPVPACDVTWRPDGLELAIVQAGPTCDPRIGPIVRVSPKKPRELMTVVLRGQHPSYRPIVVSPAR